MLPLLMFLDKFLMSDVLTTNLMLPGLFLMFPTISLVRMKCVRFILLQFLSSISHPRVFYTRFKIQTEKVPITAAALRITFYVTRNVTDFSIKKLQQGLSRFARYWKRKRLA